MFTKEDNDLIYNAFESLRIASLKRCANEQEYEGVIKAFEFANEAHKGVRRRSGEPYILHPIAVAKIVVEEIGLGYKSIVTALLHDIVEDTEYTVEDIARLFGDKIASLAHAEKTGARGLVTVLERIFRNFKFELPSSGVKEFEVDTDTVDNPKQQLEKILFEHRNLRADEMMKDSIKNKASLVFALPHTAGSLSKVLSVLSFYDMNLTKIQSLPIIGREWEYMFYINLTFVDYTRYRQALDAIRPLTKDFKILGEYEEGRQGL